MTDILQNLIYPIMVGLLLYGWSAHRSESREILSVLSKTNQTLAQVLEQLKELKETTAKHADELKEHSIKIVEAETTLKHIQA